MKATIPKIPVTNNRYLRMHWAVRKQENDSWWRWVHKQCGFGPFRTGPSKKGPRRAKVDIIVFRARRQDPDNAVASCKPLIDALKRCYWLVDDSSRWIDLQVSERLAKDNKRTEIEVTYGLS